MSSRMGTPNRRAAKTAAIQDRVRPPRRRASTPPTPGRRFRFHLPTVLAVVPAARRLSAAPPPAEGRRGRAAGWQALNARLTTPKSLRLLAAERPIPPRDTLR